MIKLIASDIDGTLLMGGAKKLSAEAFELIERLHQKGVLFAAASGRQYPNLRRLFAPIWKDMLFICENGALVMYHGEVLSSTEIPRALGCALMRDILAHGDCEAALSGKTTSYFQPKSAAFMDRMLYTSGNTVTVVDDLCAVDEPFLKISVYDAAGVANHSAEYFHQKWAGQIEGAIAGFEWFDFTLADKGTGISLLRDRFGLQKEQILAFGDNFNDLPMFREVGHSYAMETAADGVKSAARHTAARVEDTLRALLKNGLV